MAENAAWIRKEFLEFIWQ